MKADYINNRQKVVDYLASHLKGEKFEHSLGVEAEAVAMAKRSGVDPTKAGLAALLHDVTKQMDNIHLAKLYNIPALVEKTLHGPTAAAYLKDKGVVDDEEVLSAIRYHTTGRANMTQLEKIIFLADMTEPMRDFAGIDQLRHLAATNMDKAVLMALATTLSHVLRKKSLIETESVSAYNYYRNLFSPEEI